MASTAFASAAVAEQICEDHPEQDSTNQVDGNVFQRQGSLRLRHRPSSNVDCMNDSISGNDHNQSPEVQTEIKSEPMPVDPCESTPGNDPNQGPELQNEIKSEPMPMGPCGSTHGNDTNQGPEVQNKIKSEPLPTGESELPEDMQTDELVGPPTTTFSTIRVGENNQVPSMPSRIIEKPKDPEPPKETAFSNFRLGENNQAPCMPSKVIGKSNDPEPPKEKSIFQITVRNLDGKHFSFQVSTADRVERLMQMIKDRIGVPQEQQKLNYAGKILVQGMTLGHYGIHENSTVFLEGRLRGG